MTTRGIVVPHTPGWAVAAPTVGPGFASTPFRVPAFQEEATDCWRDFLKALGEQQEPDEFDLDVSELQPPDLRAVASQLVQASLQTAAQAAGGSGEAGSGDAAAAGPSGSQADSAAAGPSRASGSGVAGGPGSSAAAAAGAPSPPAAGGTPSAGKASGRKRGRPAPAPGRGRDCTHGRVVSGAPAAGPHAFAPEDLAFPSIPRQLRPQKGRRQPRKAAQLAFAGEASALERRLRQEFRDSAQTLRSVQEAQATPADHATPLNVKSANDFQRAPLRPAPVATAAAAQAGPRLPADEAVLRIDVREFDAVHSTLQEWLVPASQAVGALRDAVSCPADRNLAALGLGVRGAFVYVDGTFLVDPGGLDYTPQILAFCRQHGLPPPPDAPPGVGEALPRTHRRQQARRRGRRGGQPEPAEEGEEPPGEWRVRDMRRTCWADLSLRVGAAAGSVLCHQGCCEHLLALRDVRRLHADDPQHAGAYPLCIREEAAFRRQCGACELGMAVKVTYDDAHAPACPAFWCEACYRGMHYAADGRLAHAHRVFPYTSG